MECSECGAALGKTDTECPDCGAGLPALKDGSKPKVASTAPASRPGVKAAAILTHSIALIVGVVLGMAILRAGLPEPIEPKPDPTSMMGMSSMPEMPPNHPEVAPGTKAPPLTQEMMDRVRAGEDPHAGIDMGTGMGMGMGMGMSADEPTESEPVDGEQDQ